ncbi:MAG TPA: rhodanese-like domain-containing protein [Candidatus Tectomicrobia bacterium]
MTASIATQGLAAHLEHPVFVIVDVRDMAAFNGWTLHGEARGGHIRGAVAFPLEWTAIVKGPALLRLFAAKGITPHSTVVVYDVQRHRSVAMACQLRRLGYSKVLTYDAGVAAWAADERLPMTHLPHYERLVPPAWVRQLICGQCPATYTGQRFAICEVGWRNATVYATGHIPGARYFALHAYEQAPLWTRVSDAVLEERLLVEGITYNTTVVLYGKDTTAVARAAVLLMYAGVHDVRILDGGFAAWRAAGYPIETTVHRPAPVTDFGTILPAHPEYLIETEEANVLRTEGRAALVSVRSWAEQSGATSGYSYIKPKGRIAGDVWGHAGSAPLRMDYYRNVDNTMRNYHDIAARWRAWGITPEKRVAFYCGTGWRASEAFFYASLMGWATIAVYDGGWWAWVQDPANPIALGAPQHPMAGVIGSAVASEVRLCSQQLYF